MAANQAMTGQPEYDAGGTSPARAWRFSLGSLFRVMAVSGVAMLAVRQFGPLAAARDVGLALAVVLGITAYCTRSRQQWLWAGLAAALGLVPTILAGGAPFSRHHAMCTVCGQSRDTYEVCGWTVTDNVKSNDVSQWAEPLLSAGHAHQWAGCSTTSRASWFGGTEIGCGGPREGATRIWHLARLGDSVAAERFLREYFEIKAGASPKSLAVHVLEVDQAIIEASK